MLAALAVPAVAWGQSVDEDARLERLDAMSLEDLLNREVTSVSRRPEKLFESAAAVFTISDEDIRRSGATTIVESLRMSPGLMVGQLTSSSWAVGSRGMADRYADTLLVMMDGRTVYSPLNSGVNWSRQDYLLEDLQQIEVIRGPGGTLWGANAVNGVINIVSKDAADTQGWFADAGGGTEEQGFVGVRYGGTVGETGHWRAYGKYFNRAEHPGGIDTWSGWQGGFRADWELEQAHLTVQGDVRRHEARSIFHIPDYSPARFHAVPVLMQELGGNLLARATVDLAPDSQLTAQAYFDHVQSESTALGNFDRDQTVDVDLQHQLGLPGNQTLTYGLGYRYLPVLAEDNLLFTYAVNQRHNQLFSGFIQDEIRFFGDQVRLTIGTKVEHHDLTGWELLPSGRLAWVPDEANTLWGSVSRAVQVPGKSFTDLRTPLLSDDLGMAEIAPGVQVPVYASGSGNPNLDAQELLAFELGYRRRFGERVLGDLVLFRHQYDQLISGAPGGPPTFQTTPFPHLLVPIMAVNGAKVSSLGAELSVEWQVDSWWKLAAAYTYFDLSFDRPQIALSAEGKDPAHQVSLRSVMDLPGNWQLDLWGRFVDELPYSGVDHYFDLDVRLAWQPKAWLELSVVGQNLIEPERVEFRFTGSTATQTTPVPRGVYAEARFRF
jgi:iron complex outermembrane receptor protein